MHHSDSSQNTADFLERYMLYKTCWKNPNCQLKNRAAHHKQDKKCGEKFPNQSYIRLLKSVFADCRIP